MMLSPQLGWLTCETCNGTGEVIDAARVAFDALLVAAEKYLAAIDENGKLSSMTLPKKAKAARGELRQVVANVRLMKEG